jgi:hypothetical protein
MIDQMPEELLRAYNNYGVAVAEDIGQDSYTLSFTDPDVADFFMKLHVGPDPTSLPLEARANFTRAWARVLLDAVVTSRGFVTQIDACIPSAMFAQDTPEQIAAKVLAKQAAKEETDAE